MLSGKRVLHAVVGMMMAASVYNNVFVVESIVGNTVDGEASLSLNGASNANSDLTTNDDSNSNSNVLGYSPASSEQFVVDHTHEFGFDKNREAFGCQLYPFFLDNFDPARIENGQMQGFVNRVVAYAEKRKDVDMTFAKDLTKDMEAYDKYLKEYTRAIQDFQPVPDLMASIVSVDAKDGKTINTNHDVCNTVKIHPDGLPGIFLKSGGTIANQNKNENVDQPKEEHPFLSYTTSSGYVEPILPPMRSHQFCDPNRIMEKSFGKVLMELDYLVHDFEHMCRSLKPTSRRIFIDMGASLAFHQTGTVPVVQLLELYEKFGFNFDHIYGFEITFQEPNLVFGELLPEKYLANYHWINVGITHEEGHRLNPLHSILSQFNEDDFIVVKLDIDTASIEVPLAHQLLNDPTYHKLIDQFYFEHHVHLAELAANWRGSMKGSVADSLHLFHNLRQKGIPAHFWP